jgi:hypothetical protein
MPPKKTTPPKDRKLTVERDIIEGRILAQLKNAGFWIESTNFKEPVYDAIAKRDDYGRTRTYGIHIKFELKGYPLMDVEVSRFASSGKLDEYWIIAEAFDHSAESYIKTEPNIRLFTLDQFERYFRDYPARQPAPRAKGARAVAANYAEVKLNTEALVLLLDAKIVSLKRERPNSDEKIAERDRDLKQYEALQRSLVTLSTTATDFHAGNAKETALTEASKSFADCVRLWWKKSPERICQSAYAMSMFLSAVTVCSLVGANGNVAVIVSAALVGGKPATDVLKKLGKKLFD